MEKIEDGMVEFAKWLCEFRNTPQGRDCSGEALLQMLPMIDPEFEDRKLVYEIRGILEKCLNSHVQKILQPVETDPNLDPRVIQDELIENAVRILLQSKEYQEFMKGLSESMLRVKPSIMEILNTKKNSSSRWEHISGAKQRQTPHEGFEIRPMMDDEEFEADSFRPVGEGQFLTVEELSNTADLLKSTGMAQEMAIDNISRLNPLDVIWHDKFSEIVRPLFAYLTFSKIGNARADRVHTFLKELTSACKSSMPQKLLELLDEWIKMASKLVGSVSHLLVPIFQLLSTTLRALVDFQYLIPLAQLEEYTKQFCKLIELTFDQDKQNDNLEKAIETLIDSDILLVLIKNPQIRELCSKHWANISTPKFLHLQFLQDSSKGLTSASLRVLLIIQENLALYKANCEDFMRILMSELLSIIQHDKIQTTSFEWLLNSLGAVLRFKSPTIESSKVFLQIVQEALAKITNLHFQSWMMTTLSTLLESSPIQLEFSLKLASQYLTHYSLDDTGSKDQKEYNACVLKLVESVGRNVGFEQTIPHLNELVKSKVTQNVLTLILKGIHKTWNNFNKNKELQSQIIHTMTEKLFLEASPYNYLLQNSFSILLLNHNFSVLLASTNFVDALLTKYFENNCKKSKSLLCSILSSPGFLLHCSIENKDYVSHILSRIVTNREASETYHGLKILKMALLSQTSDFLFLEFSLSEMLLKLLHELRSDNPTIITESTELIEEIFKTRKFSPVDSTNLFDLLSSFDKDVISCEFVENLDCKKANELADTISATEYPLGVINYFESQGAVFPTIEKDKVQEIFHSWETHVKISDRIASLNEALRNTCALNCLPLEVIVSGLMMTGGRHCISFLDSLNLVLVAILKTEELPTFLESILSNKLSRIYEIEGILKFSRKILSYRN